MHVTGPATLDVFFGAPVAFTPRARWVLGTLLAPLGRQVRLLSDREAADGCALAYAPAPVPGVPTIPCDAGAMDIFAKGQPLARGAFAQLQTPAGGAAGAFPAAPGSGFALPFDLVSSAFVLLACWDERTSSERDRFGRLPFSAGVFAANPALKITEPAVDGYVSLLRTVLGPRLAELDLEELPPGGWLWNDGQAGSGGFAVALTHDVDTMWRWTARGFVAAGRRCARALRHGDRAALRRELGDLLDWATVHLPRRSDPHWTFPRLLSGEDERGVTSTFYVIASHGHRQDGNQPQAYRKRIPVALDLLRRGHREVGLHGNDADRRGVDALRLDRDDLVRRSGAGVSGIRYHYLRCLYHETLSLVEEAGLAYDTSLAFAEHEGFRCGASFPFHPYHLDEERPMRLFELPLAIMDTSLLGERYRALDAAEAEHACRDLLSRVHAAGGGVAILWHNNRFDHRSARGYDDVYWRLVDWLRSQGGLVTSAEEVVRRWREGTEEVVT
jgi:peptidoglycan/xylan/chitin deacetylase (PgdA/CDA1 family)